MVVCIKVNFGDSKIVMLSGLNFCLNIFFFNFVYLFILEGVVWYFNLGFVIDCKVFDLCGF